MIWTVVVGVVAGVVGAGIGAAVAVYYIGHNMFRGM